MVFQRPAFRRFNPIQLTIEHQRAAEFISRCNKAALEARLKELLHTLVELPVKLSRYPAELGGGSQRTAGVGPTVERLPVGAGFEPT